MRILVVDDEKEMRVLLERSLTSWGYEVTSVKNGKEALEVIEESGIYFVVSDWMMPGMDGPELCKRIRKSSMNGYIYIIMLTAKGDVKEIVEGLESGADDFVVKPFNREELRVRIKAGERILSLERGLEDKNRDLEKSNAELKGLYSDIARDLEAAAKGQKSLLPHTPVDIFGYSFDSLFLPSRYLAGDMFNFFTLDENHIAFYLLDVMGHGVPAAMLSVTISRLLSPLPVYASILKRPLSMAPYYELVPPAGVVRELNDRFQSSDDYIQYFTMVYGLIDKRDSSVRFVQAGHPSPLYTNGKGAARRVGDGGFPVGMVTDVEYEEVCLTLNKGDNLFIYSDGTTECPGDKGETYSEGRLSEFLGRGREEGLGTILEKVEADLNGWRRGNYFEDDVSILAIGRG